MAEIITMIGLFVLFVVLIGVAISVTFAVMFMGITLFNIIELYLKESRRLK